MAGALVGGAFLSAFLQVLFDRMASPEVVDFFRSRKLDEGRLLQKLKTELLSANAVLDDAEEKQMTNDHVREWLDELKDAVYDVDDLFDEIATEDLKREAGVEPRTLACKVWSFAADTRRSKLAPDTRRSKLGDELERVLERLESVVKQRQVLGLMEGFRERTARALQTTSLVEESGVFGREKDREAVIKLLLSDPGEKNTSVMAIVGMGGLGKTTLSQLVFNDGAVKGSFDLRSWVCVSDQFDICKLTATALEEFSSSSKKETENLNQLQLQLKDFLTGKKFLLVLDDVWNEDSNLWDAFLVPFTYGARGSKIVVTTRNEGVALVARAVSTYPLQKLQDEESWDLFAKHAFDQHNLEARTRLEDIGQRIVKRCDGLPLALKTIGSLLRCESGIRKWEIIAESNIWDLPPGKNKILPALLLSYHYLPPQLKRCFAYCSIFPKDCIYEKDQLSLLWIAEGLLKQPNDSRTLEEVGDQCFCDLVSRSLLHRASDVQPSFLMYDLEVSYVKSSFSMHDLVNDLARYVAGRSFFSLDGGNAHHVSSSTRHLSFVRTHYDVASKFRVLARATNLHTFLPLNVGPAFYGRNLSDEVLHVLLPTLRWLRVLSLSHYRKRSLPSSIGCLKHLRYLNLSHNDSLIRLPDSITALFNLQTLILTCCKSLIELPSNMGSLTCLRHLDIRGTSLKRMPLGMNRLKNLQTLTNFVVAKNGGTRVRELGELGNLMGTFSIQGLQNVDSYRDAEIVNLQEKRYLEKLVLRWGSGNNIMKQNCLNVLDKLQPHWNLRELIINFYSGRSFSDWVGHGSFSNMSVVCLESCKHCVSLPPLEQLPSLEKLIIKGFDGVTSVGTEFNGSNCIPFQSLKYLEFADMCSWKEWACFAIETGGLAFAHLQELCIRNCPELSGGLPSHLPSLTALSIEECPQLTSSSLPFAPLLREINLDDCGKVSGVEPLLNGTELRDMRIKRLLTLPLRFLPPTVTRLSLGDSPGIELPIHRCHESLQYLTLWHSCNSLISFPLEIFPSLKDIQLMGIQKLKNLSNSDSSPLHLHSMDIRYCPEFRSFPAGGLAAPCLTSLHLKDCHHLKYLPENMQALLPSLQSLIIVSCPQIESFPERGLPSKLVELSLSKCDKLITGRKDWGLQSLCSLETFFIGQEKNIESFPEVGLLPTCLTSLHISLFENLTSLNSRALHSLSSLENLSIFGCPKLHSFPKEGQILPASLTSLSIFSTGLKSLDNLGLHHLTRLKEFDIDNCRSLRSMPAEGLSSSLSNLFISGCPLLAKRCQRKKGKDWPRVSHIRCIVIEHVLVT